MYLTKTTQHQQQMAPSTCPIGNCITGVYSCCPGTWTLSKRSKQTLLQVLSVIFSWLLFRKADVLLNCAQTPTIDKHTCDNNTLLHYI